MAYENDNIYGLQKVEPQQVRNNMDMATSSTGMMAQGAKAGSAFGLPGTIIGGAAGLALGAHANLEAKKEEEARYSRGESYNRFIDSLGGRASRTQQAVGIQARNGFHNNAQEMAEIEGDGGDKGIGEIHVDKNYNIKTIANGGKRHEEGGVKVMMEEGDIIFPTQNSEGKYKKILSDIKRYKQYGDGLAKKRLDKERDNLPTDEEYSADGIRMFYDGGEYQTAYEEASSKIPEAFSDREERIQQILEREGWNTETKTRTNSEGKDYPVNTGQRKLTELAEKHGLDPDQVEKFARNSGGLFEDAQQSGDFTKVREAAKANGIEDFEKYMDFLDEAIGEGKNITGKRTGADSSFGKMTTGASDQLRQAYDKADSDYEAALDEFTDYGEIGFGEAYEGKPEADEVTAGSGFMGSGKDPSEILMRANNVGADIPRENLSPELRQSMDAAGGNLNINRDRTPSSTTMRGQEVENKSFEVPIGNPLKYANSLYNLGMGIGPAETVTRRNFVPEEIQYKDRSEAQRQANIENRNFATRQLQGRVDRTGSLGTMGQVGAGYIREAGRINEAESRLQEQIAQQNVGIRNQAKQLNLQNALRYDEQDAMNRAARQSFTGTGMTEVSELAQFDEQMDYMKSRDAIATQMDLESLKYIGSRKYALDPKTKEIVYREQPSTTFSTRYIDPTGKTTSK